MLLSRHSFVFTDFTSHRRTGPNRTFITGFLSLKINEKAQHQWKEHIPTLLSVKTVTFRACGWQSQWSRCWRIYYFSGVSCVSVQNKHTLHGPAVPAGEPIISNPVSPGNSKAPVFVTSQSSFFHVYPSCFWLFGSRNNRLRSRQAVTTDLVRPRQNEPLT